MVVFPAFGLLIVIAFLLAAFILCSILAGVLNLVVWLMDLKPRPTGRKPVVAARPVVPAVQARAEAQPTSDIWPKWTASHRRYMESELALWQEYFDALDSRK